MTLASATAENAATNAVAALITFASLHTATPGTTGASEYAGVTRQAIAWGTASAGVAANTGAITWTTSGATAVPYAGGWTAVTAGTYELGFTLGSSVTAITITAAIGAVTIGTT